MSYKTTFPDFQIVCHFSFYSIISDSLNSDKKITSDKTELFCNGIKKFTVFREHPVDLALSENVYPNFGFLRVSVQILQIK